MRTVEAVARYLEEIGELAPGGPRHLPRPSAALAAVTPEETAGGGAVSWLSAGRIAKDPSRPERYAGELLLVPGGSAVGAGARAAILGCLAPKAALAHVVERFFPELLASPWPEQGGVHPKAKLGRDVRLAPGVVVGEGCVLGDGVEIGPNTVLAHATVGARTRIGANCSIGLAGFGYERDARGGWIRFPHVGQVIIGEDVEIGSNSCVDRGALGATRLGAGVKVDNLVHVAHNVTIGPGTLVIANAMLGGSVTLGANVWIAPSASILNQIGVGDGAVVGMGAVVLKPVEPGQTIIGNPGRPLAPKHS